MFADQYAGRRVFLTGHTGFKGFWLTAWLLELGAEVAGFSIDIPTSPSGFAALGLEKRIRHMEGDVRDRASLCRALEDFAPEAVFHLAAQPLVRRSFDDAAATFESNAMGTLNMLEAVRATPSVKALVLITSDKCYRNDEWVFGYRENDHLGGNDPYSASKACAEIIAHSYCQSFFRQGPLTATARAGNVIGGGDWAEDRIVPDCVRAWAAGKAALLRNPGSTRPWQHVLEPLSGYLWLGALFLGGARARDGFALHGEAFNFGPAANVRAPVAALAAGLGAYWPGFAARYAPDEDETRTEHGLLKLCCDKALAHLGWKPALSFEDCLRLTAEWYVRYYALQGKSLEMSGAAMYACTLEQIASYCAQAERGKLSWLC
ncbi:CDP-glucose 4,6-dehydratase [Desulfovibrio sp. OttesenSCG-928-G11]|nr:CDP-glucose 4,6-dehydratase [Desulfovibrio sp. OttesenSCG-928-G11]